MFCSTAPWMTELDCYWPLNVVAFQEANVEMVLITNRNWVRFCLPVMKRGFFAANHCLIMTYENIILTGRWFKCACAVIWIWIHVCNYTHVSICVWAMNGLCRFLESTLETHAQPGDDCSLLIYCQYNVIRKNLMVSLFISYSCSLTGSDCPSVRIRTERKEANIW